MPVQKKRRTAGSVIASVFLSLLLIGPLTAGVIWWETRDLLSEEGIKYCLDSIEPEKIRLSDIGSGGEGTLLDKLAVSLNEVFGSGAVTASELKEKLEASTLKPFIAREIGGVLEDFKNGTSRAAVTPEELTEFVEENMALFSDLIPAVSDEELAAAADMAAAGGAAESGFTEVIQDYLKKHDPPKKYEAMVRTFQETGKIEEKDRDLLIEFMKNDLIPGVYKDKISEKLAETDLGKLNTAYLRSQLGHSEEKFLGRAFSMLPLYALIGFCAVLVLLYFVADRHIVGDAFIGIGALLLTVCGALTAAGLLHPGQEAFWQRLAEENYLAYCLSGAFLRFHEMRNLTVAGIGLGLVLIGMILNGISRLRSMKSEKPVWE